MAHRILVDGVDMSAYCPRAGYRVSFVTVDGGQGGLMLDGSDTVDELAVWEQIEIPCLPLTEAQMQAWLSILAVNAVHTVVYYSPRFGERSIQAKRTLPKLQYRGAGGTGLEWWTGAVITLKEVSA